jgi:hypothetical protein
MIFFFDIFHMKKKSRCDAVNSEAQWHAAMGSAMIFTGKLLYCCFTAALLLLYYRQRVRRNGTFLCALLKKKEKNRW